jgi:hypothetical protein
MAFQRRHPLARQAPTKPQEEPRLAHTGLAHDAHHLPLALLDLREQPVHGHQFLLPAYKAAEREFLEPRRRGTPPPQPYDAVCSHVAGVPCTWQHLARQQCELPLNQTSDLE